nr:hypothetical protein [Methylobacterium sp. ZNC0032]
MFTYRYANPFNNLILRSDGLAIPTVEDNTDFRALLDEGVAIDPYVPPVPPAPTVVSKAQAQMALYNAGLLDQLEAVIAAHEYRPVRIWYDSANEWLRSNPYVSMLAPELGITEEEIDALFIAAARL